MKVLLSLFFTLVPLFASGQSRGEALQVLRLAIPEAFLTTQDGHTFGGDLRIGDLNGDGRCDFLVYRCDDRGPGRSATGGFKPSYLGAFDMDGRVLWSAGKGGTHPVRPMSVAVHDLDGDGSAEVICFWYRPQPEEPASWQSLADVVVQIRDGRTGKVLREAAPPEITERKCWDKVVDTRPIPLGRRIPNWVHQRILVANFRGTDRPRDFVVKLGDTHVALDEHLNVLWSYQTEWIEYGQCPAYIPSVGDIDGDGRDELNSGFFLLDEDGTPLWEGKLGEHMDSVAIARWDDGHMRAICSGFGHVMDASGNVVLSLGKEEVPHGQEVRVANFRDDLAGPEMVLRHKGHTPDLILVSSATNRIVSQFQLNPSPNNVGMEAVFWNGPGQAALLVNGGWLWDLESRTGTALPDLPPANGGNVHRMGFYHAIPADVLGDAREEVVLWDPTATEVFVYTPAPLAIDPFRDYGGFQAGLRQFNPRIMD